MGALKLSFRSLKRQSVLLFFSFLLIVSIVFINITHIPAFYRIILMFFHILLLLFLLSMMIHYERHQILQRQLHQRHIKAMRVLLRKDIPLIQTVDYSRDAVIILDNTGMIIDSSPQASLLLALSESLLVGHPISIILGNQPNFHPSSIPENGDFAWETHKNVTKHIKFLTRTLLDDDLPSGIILTLFDNSEEKIRLEANVQVAKFSIVNEVSAGLAHEIRNPLTTIKGFMQLIKPEQWPESFRQYQQLILNEIESIDQVLSKFVLSTSPSAPHIQQLNLIETIHAATQLIQPFRIKQGVTLILKISSPSVYIMGDHEQLLQALLSLLNNAIKASPKGGKVIMRLVECESHVRISVMDNGPGIPKDLRHRVLDPFFTTQADGTGLGLTIAQQIILAHHGKLHFSESIQPCGTEAMIDLPCLSTFTNSLFA